MPRTLDHHSPCEARGEPAPILLLSPFHTFTRTGAGFTLSPILVPKDLLCRMPFRRNLPEGLFVQNADFLFRSHFWCKARVAPALHQNLTGVSLQGPLIGSSWGHDGRF